MNTIKQDAEFMFFELKALLNGTKSNIKVSETIYNYFLEQRQEQLIDFANQFNKEAGFPFNSEGIPEYVEDYLMTQFNKNK
jgi:hypothetical protein